MLAISVPKHRMLTPRVQFPRIGIGSLITAISKLEFQQSRSGRTPRFLNPKRTFISEYYTDGRKSSVFDYGPENCKTRSLFGVRMEDELAEDLPKRSRPAIRVGADGDSIKTLVRDFRSFDGAETGLVGGHASLLYPPSSPKPNLRINSNVHPHRSAASGW